MSQTVGAEITGIYGAYFWVRLNTTEILPGIHPLFLDNKRPVLLAKPSGRLRSVNLDKGEHLLVIGDQVQVELNPGAGEEITATIVSVEKRKNFLRRAAADRVQTLAANIDLVLLISSCDEPAFNPGFIDRVLCACELAQIPVVLVINKSDLLSQLSKEKLAELLSYLDLYTQIGYTCFQECFTKGISPELASLLCLKRILLLGQSGVGKSTFLNLRAQSNIQRTNTVGVANKGRHTTVNPVLYSMPNGEELIDVPGLREFGLQHLKKKDIRLGFREFKDKICRFEDCLHYNEPHCAVIAAIEQGEISEQRYKSYLAIVESLKEKFKPRKGDYWRGIRK